jgi:hypothetical protein
VARQGKISHPYHSTPEEFFLRPNIPDNFLPNEDFWVPSLLLLTPLELLLLVLTTPLGVLAFRAEVGVVANFERVAAALGWVNCDLAPPYPADAVLAGGVFDRVGGVNDRPGD